MIVKMGHKRSTLRLKEAHTLQEAKRDPEINRLNTTMHTISRKRKTRKDSFNRTPLTKP
jgi:hypothetical protein